MKRLTLEYPEDLPQVVSLTPAELEAQVRLMAAVKMFELGKLSSGKAAELAGLSRVDFLDACARYRVPAAGVDPSAADLAQDAQNARENRS